MSRLLRRVVEVSIALCLSWLAIAQSASAQLSEATSSSASTTKPSASSSMVSLATTSLAKNTSTEGAARAMTLSQALDYAHEHQPLMKQARARIAAAQAVAKIPKGQWVPQIGGLAQILAGTSNNTTSSYTSDPVIDIPRIGGTSAVTSGSLRPYPSTFVGLGLSQEIFDFGRIAAQSVALEQFVDVERYHADADRLDLDLAVHEAYFAVQGAKAVVDAAESAYARAKAHRELAKAGVDNGLRPPIELARSEADLARFDVGRIRARGGLTLARAVFAAAVGIPDGLLDAAGTEPAPATLPPLDQAIAKASARDPILKLAMSELRAQEENTKAIGAEMRPNIFLSATLSGRAGGAPLVNGDKPTGGGFLPVIPNWDVGLVLSIPFLDGVVNAREEASRVKEDVLRAELDLRAQQEVAEIQQAYRSLEVAQETIPALESALAAAKINYAQADARFKGGLATSVEVADAEAVLTDAEIQLALGRFELARSRAVFGRTIVEGL